MPGWAALDLDELPAVADVAPAASGPTWYPLQHVFGLTAFGANAFVAVDQGDVLVAEHDETGSGQEELYVVVRGRVEFTIDDSVHVAQAVHVVVVRDPSVKRSAVALEPATSLLVIGGEPAGEFHSTWRAEHFEGVPRLL